ncbi:hypothetical protein XMM379_002060 [Aliiroseovarius sp. xm-m-379]|uniref:ABC transporter substrate-binding protein n=1 Tax=unclassified Aliiroseovarius TaxID=2623558 RepID=UPI001568FD9E|nr:MULTISPECIES: ABC transporter substrate-binding protein [unclassified Aliiroseovarius]NRP12136.1 hypothetical protein [Aliiroseovarius sp. xm-d-517]NRP25364.1 hypothetical protein [Aliiroseovarius sp. xm-m-379]NRP34163.1 hypothetical protein [Aliiroseovarius sp. xm-a-104]NRP41370.1 hypothetical protein [Aliiroseovarius sp. xm-m-339-2]NRP50658.1 hypothetical protein [Aliiroseovarius sp. xm-m-354]
MRQVLVAGAVASICLGGGTAHAEEALIFPPGSGAFSWGSYHALSDLDLSGDVLTISGGWLGPDQEMLENVIAYFEQATGADVRYAGSDSIEQQIVIDIEAGSPPNIAMLFQPGLVEQFAARGKLTPLSEDTVTWTLENYAAGQSWVDLGTFRGPQGAPALYGFVYKVDVKSLVWYVPENFEEAGYSVPGSMEELIALTDQIVADGGTPWCIGLGSAGATGWPATDWVEDFMLRSFSPEDYDAWVRNDMRFDDPKVVSAIEAFGRIARNDAYVAGGAQAVATTDFRDSPQGLFASPPHCYLHRQASFIPSFFPDSVDVGLDADFFYFPAFADKDLGKPVLGSGSLWVITKDSPAAQAFMEFLKTPIAHEVWMAQKSFLTPHKGVNASVYTDPTLAKMNDILLHADTFRFDGSDLMPAAIGAGAFWTGMIDYASGKEAAFVARDIQKTWDTLK